MRRRTNCSGLPGRTSLRPYGVFLVFGAGNKLFRSSRPDFIETETKKERLVADEANCSGLPGRTSLRRVHGYTGLVGLNGNCSGLPGRTSLRRILQSCSSPGSTDCSGLPGRTSLRRTPCALLYTILMQLFRSSRPDFIETGFLSGLVVIDLGNCSGLPGRTSLRHRPGHRQHPRRRIVPVFQAGLH